MDITPPRGRPSGASQDLGGGCCRWGLWIRARRMALFPLFSLGAELCWDTAGSAPPFELSHRCQDPPALAVGQRGHPPSLGWVNPKSPTPTDGISRGCTISLTLIPPAAGEMLKCLLRVPAQLRVVAVRKHVQNQSQNLLFSPHFQVRQSHPPSRLTFGGQKGGG